MKCTTLEIDDQESILIIWKENWSFFQVKQDGETICPAVNKEQLKGGVNVRTKSGKVVGFIFRDDNLEAWYEGKDLVSGVQSGSDSGFRNGMYAMYFAITSCFVTGLLYFLRLLGTGAIDKTSVFVFIFAMLPAVLFAYLANKINSTGNSEQFLTALAAGVILFLIMFIVRVEIPNIYSIAVMSVWSYLIWKGSRSEKNYGIDDVAVDYYE